MTDLASIVRLHGGDLGAGGRTALIPGPGHSRKDRSLSLKLEGDRITWFSFAGDPNRDVMDYLGIGQDADRPRLSRAEQEQRERERAAEALRREREALAFCETVWTGARPLAGSLASTYLRGRKLNLDACADLRFHPEAPRSRPDSARPTRTAPAMLALVRDVQGRPRGLHVTFIAPDGSGKAFGDRSRIMFGPVRGGAVRLFPMGASGALAVGEGIETSASFAGLRGLPAWATLSTAGLASFLIPPQVRALTIAADNDDAPLHAGLSAARALAHKARCSVEIEPAPLGMDWGDVWTAEADHGR